MTQDIVSTIFWGGLTFVWIMLTSELGLTWWTNRISTLDDMENLDEADAMWWAYISFLTCGN
jgi:hypothetical protein